MTGNSPPPGWYTDGQGGQRWWDGTKWYEAAEPRPDETRVDDGSANAGAPPELTDFTAETGPRRKSSKPPRSATGVLGSVIALAGILLAAVAVVLLVMVNPDCLNNEECGQFNQGFWELFGIKSAALVSGLLLIGAGLLLRRRARKAVRPVPPSAQSTSSKGSATPLRRKRVWIPLVAVTCLALAAGTWQVATAGPSDEERRTAAEKRESAAAEEAEQQAEAELALMKETCESTLSDFKQSVEEVDSKLDVGLIQNDFNNALGDASVAYNQLELDPITDDEYCLTKVAGPLEDAFRVYVKSNNKWSKCNESYVCEVKGQVLKDLQARWLKSTLKIAEADQALENYEAEAASI